MSGAHPAGHTHAREIHEVRAWRPAVAGITEVLHAHFTDHAYPVHTHDTWDLYLTGRRIDRARRLLLAGERPVDVAAEVGFYDQAHLNRHFTRHLGISPARYAKGGRRR
jgi:transcriptional regulator GlxA family with amidase domain